MGIVLLVTTLAALTPVGAQLYAQVYPEPSQADLEVTPNETVEDNLFPAEVVLDIDESMVENETSKVRIELVLIDPSDEPGSPISVSYQNQARLRAECPAESAPCAEIVPGPEEWQNRIWPQASWEWDITPRKPGLLNLTLDVQPFLCTDGECGQGLEQINETVSIRVEVHEQRTLLNTVLAAVDGLQLIVQQDDVNVGEPFDVTAVYDYANADARKGVDVDAELVVAQGAARVRRGSPSPGSPDVLGRWDVTATDAGALELNLVVEASADIGDTNETDERTVSRELIASEPPPAWYKSLWAALGGVVVFLIAAFSLIKIWLEIRKLLRERRSTGSRRRGKDDHDVAREDDSAFRGGS